MPASHLRSFSISDLAEASKKDESDLAEDTDTGKVTRSHKNLQRRIDSQQSTQSLMDMSDQFSNPLNSFSPNKRSFRGPGVIARGLLTGPKSVRRNWPLLSPVDPVASR